MAIDKKLSPGKSNPDDESINMEVIVDVDTETTELPDGSVEVVMGELVVGDAGLFDEVEFGANLVDIIDQGELEEIASDLETDIENDILSRSDWVSTYVKGLKLLGFEYEERTEPWKGASGVNTTVLGEAVIRFQAETMSETFPPAGPVKTKILGKETKDKIEAAERVRADMNYELTEKMIEYRDDHERMLFGLGLSGSAFKKVYNDPALGRQVATYIEAENLVVPASATNISSSERVTHIIRRTKIEMENDMASGFYSDVELDEPTPFFTDIETAKKEQGGITVNNDDRYTLYECHTNLDIEGTGVKPYVITIEKDSRTVLSVRRNWMPEDGREARRQHFVHYCYIPGFNFYGLGLIHLVGNFARAGTSIIRQLIDSGTLANLQGGFKTKGSRVSSEGPIKPGEYRDVESINGGALRENIIPLPYKEPSQVLAALLDKVVAEGRRMGAVSDLDISDMSGNAPVGTTLALLERILRPMAAVQTRVHNAMKAEFKLLKELIADNASKGQGAGYEYDPSRGEVSARQEDYSMVEVIPVSNPNSTTMAQRIAQYQTALQMSSQAREVYDEAFLHRQMLEVIDIPNADKIVPTKDDIAPADPVSENMNALQGTPIKAFLHQDHEAHLAAHQSFMQDPMIAQNIGQNPQAQQIMAALHAHIAEHTGFLYRKQIEEKIGVPLPPPNEALPKEIEVELSRLQAQAGAQITAEHSKQAAQAQAQEQAQDPILQNRAKETEIKAMEVQRKIAKDKVDAQLKDKQLEQEAVKDRQDHDIEQQQLELDKAELEVDAQHKGAKLSADRRSANTKLDLDALKITSDLTKSKNKEQ